MKSDNHPQAQAGPVHEPLEPVIVWISLLSWPSLVCLFSVFRKYGRFDVYAVRATGFGLFFSSLLQSVGVLKLRAHGIETRSEAVRVDDSGSPRILVQGHIPNVFTSQLFSRHERMLSGNIYPDGRVRSERVLTNLRKSAGWMTFGLMSVLENARK